MKIVIAHNWSDEGLSAQSKKLAEHLSLKHQVVFFSHTAIGADKLTINPHLTVYQWIGKRPTTWADFRLAYSVIKSFKPDVCLGNFGAATLIAMTGFLLRVPRRIEVYHTLYRQLYLDGNQKKWFFRLKVKRKAWLYRLNNYIFTSNNFGIEDLNRYYGVPKRICLAMPNGMPDQPLRNDYSKPALIKFLGRIDKSKGVDILLEAMLIVKLRHPQVRLEIAGAGSQLNTLKQETTYKGLDDVVTFVGKISHAQVPGFLAEAGAMLIPSRMDNHPTVIMEAYSTGTPVIGSNNGGIPEMIDDRVTGLIFENDSAEQLAERIVEMLDRPDFQKKLGLQARKKFENFYAIEHYIQRMENAIEQLAV